MKKINRPICESLESSKKGILGKEKIHNALKHVADTIIKTPSKVPLEKRVVIDIPVSEFINVVEVDKRGKRQKGNGGGEFRPGNHLKRKKTGKKNKKSGVLNRNLKRQK